MPRADDLTGITAPRTITPPAPPPAAPPPPPEPVTEKPVAKPAKAPRRRPAPAPPSAAREAATVRYTIDLTPTMHHRFKRIALDNGTKASEVFRAMMSELTDEQIGAMVQKHRSQP